ncbi:hypothetical protein CTI14_66315, partial [Methylobacterium radiotolerans]
RSEIDAEKRQEIVHDMLALNYTDTAQVATWYANSLEAYRSDRFTGFTLQPKDGAPRSTPRSVRRSCTTCSR